jgi:hypothetical protein
MQSKHHLRNSGLSNTIVLIVIGIIILGYFNINLKEIFSKPQVVDNLRYSLELVLSAIQYIFHLLAQLARKYIPGL